MAQGEGISFDEILKSYDERGKFVARSTDEGTNASTFSLEGIGSRISAGFSQLGQSEYLSGTPLGTTDVESGGMSSATAQAEASFGSLSRSDRFKMFVALLSLSVFFFILSMFFIGVIVIFPAKFAFSFSLGSIFFMAAFALVKGPTAWIKSVFSREQAPFTIAYFTSVVGTLYACLVWRSYFMVMIFSGIQIYALGYYAFGNMPGGAYGLRLIGAVIKQAVNNLCIPCAKGCLMLCRSIVTR